METMRPAVTAAPGQGWPYSTEVAQHETVIRQSHERCLHFGLSSRDRPDFAALPRAQLLSALEDNSFLYQHAAPAMETLHEQIANTRSMVLLTARNGLILHSLGDRDFLEKASRVALQPGVEWSERSMGTNAIGTALTEGQPVVVRGRDHYLRANQSLTCSCTPIFDPHGRIVGALDVTGDERGHQHHTLALVRMSAQMIENRMFADVFAEAVRIHFHSRPEFIGTLVEGIAVFSPEGRFLSANRSAQFQLGQSLNCLQAHTFSSLFGQPMSRFLDRMRGGTAEPLLLRLNSGVSVWCQARIKPVERWFGAHAVGGDAAPEWQQPRAPAQAPASRRAAGRQLSSLHYLDTGDAQVAAVVRKLQRVLDRDIPIMILGETGTGKDLLAQAIHNDSQRAARPFVSVNCASIPEALIESELFGYEEGAFTGARRKGSAGRILQANGGTLFLDEIGDMPIQLQARLLRVLQERRVSPLGSGKEYEVDIAIVCATHRNLKHLIARGGFREDLYYRLNGIAVRLPALRDRSDFDTVVRKLLDSLGAGHAAPAISDDVMALFRRYHWPGNFRQLHNVLRTAVALSERCGSIRQEHLPDDFIEEMAAAAAPGAATAADDAPVVPPPLQALAANQRIEDLALQAMADALRRCRGNVSAAAKMLGVSRNTIYRRKQLLPPDCWD